MVRVEEPDQDYHITAEVSNPPTACPSCQSDALRGNGRNERLLMDGWTKNYPELQRALLETPEADEVMPDTGRFLKMRWEDSLCGKKG